MHPAARAVLAIATVVLLAPQAVAQFKGKTDPDWPCQQIKTPTFLARLSLGRASA